VVLDYIQPDPITGEVVAWKALDEYLSSQIRLLRDPQVAVPAAEILGWLDDPDVLAAYSARPSSDTRDLGAWVSAILIPRIGVRLVDESNILEITYNGESAELSRLAADAIRTAYVQSNIRARQDAARQSAEKVQVNIDRVRIELAELGSLQASIERETGVVLTRAGMDEASNSLRLMTKRPEAPIMPRERAATPTVARLARLEAEIAQASGSLGSNNPVLTNMLRAREVLRAQVTAEGSSAESRESAVGARSLYSAALYESLKARVLETREPAMRLRLLQDEIYARQEEFRLLTETMVALRGVQTTTLTSISPSGEAYSKPRPVFPNLALIFGGTGAIGLALGSVLACLAELLGRRVRTRRHLEAASGVAVLIEIPSLRPRSRERAKARQSVLPGWPKVVRTGV
jgi:uncharacterized protein involved in exopolysaccharide biosynthesis